MDRAAIQTRLDAIQDILDSGASSVTHNGRTTTYDLARLARERDRLTRALNADARSGTTRKVIYNPAAAE